MGTKKAGVVLVLFLLVGCSEPETSIGSKPIPLIKSASGKIYSPKCIQKNGIKNLKACEVTVDATKSKRGLWSDWYYYGTSTTYYYYNMWLYNQDYFCSYFGFGSGCYQYFGYTIPSNYNPPYSCSSCIYGWSTFCSNYCYLGNGYTYSYPIQYAMVAGTAQGGFNLCLSSSGTVRWVQTAGNGSFSGYLTAVGVGGSYDLPVYFSGTNGSTTLPGTWQRGSVGALVLSTPYFSTGAPVVQATASGTEACFTINNSGATAFSFSGYYY